MYDDRRKENILPIISNNVSTINQNDGDIDLRTRVYSDCFSAYSEADFNAMGYRLHRVNHSVWFGQGSFHTNTVEGLWSTIKRINNNFSGLSFNILDDITKNGGNPSDYIDDWICFSLFFRDVKMRILTVTILENI